MGQTVKPRWLTGRKLYLVNFLLFLIPLTYFGYAPLLRLSASILIVNEQPRNSDAIVVLAGGEPGRAWQAADLYHSNYAPYVVLTRERPTIDQEELRKKGIDLAGGYENYVRVLRGLGIPADRILTLEPYVEDTFDELQKVRDIGRLRKWKSLIVVTSNYHSRRARMTGRYIFGPEIALTVVASRHGGIRGEEWWTSTADVRTFIIELEKLVAYSLYIWPKMLWTRPSDTKLSSTPSALRDSFWRSSSSSIS